MLHLNVKVESFNPTGAHKARSNSTCDPFFVTFRLCLHGFAQGRADRNEEVCITLEKALEQYLGNPAIVSQLTYFLLFPWTLV